MSGFLFRERGGYGGTHPLFLLPSYVSCSTSRQKTKDTTFRGITSLLVVVRAGGQEEHKSVGAREEISHVRHTTGTVCFRSLLAAHIHSCQPHGSATISYL